MQGPESQDVGDAFLSKRKERTAMGKQYFCTSRRCNCGKPVFFRTMDGRRRPMHAA